MRMTRLSVSWDLLKKRVREIEKQVVKELQNSLFEISKVYNSGLQRYMD